MRGRALGDQDDRPLQRRSRFGHPVELQVGRPQPRPGPPVLGLRSDNLLQQGERRGVVARFVQPDALLQFSGGVDPTGRHEGHEKDGKSGQNTEPGTHDTVPPGGDFGVRFWSLQRDSSPCLGHAARHLPRSDAPDPSGGPGAAREDSPPPPGRTWPGPLPKRRGSLRNPHFGRKESGRLTGAGVWTRL